MNRLFIVMFLAVAACSGEDPCDRCDDDDYYCEHPYSCQECLQERRRGVGCDAENLMRSRERKPYEI